MDISTDLDFAADPATVYAMMLDRGYQEQVCVTSESRRWEVQITPPRTWTERPVGRCSIFAPRLPVPRLGPLGKFKG